MPAQKLDKHSLKILNMEPTGLPPNHSHQQLMSDSDSGDANCIDRNTSARNISIRDVSVREWITVIILCFVNLINYMDRFTVAGVLTDIQTHFDIQNDKGGLLQTAFVLSYMLFAPLFGYLGDRYSRKVIMALGVGLWSLTTLLGSFMDSFPGFLIFRALVGIGEASYSTIAPTIISDMFVKDIRSKMLALFYFAIPVGSGLGYIVGSETAKALGSWQWGLRVTPILGAIAVVLILFVMKEPARGESEGSDLIPTSWFDDIKELSKNASFILSTAGFTCVAFVAGALSWWGPKFIQLGLQLQQDGDVDINDVSYKFGIIAMISGLIGVPLGSFSAQALRGRFSKIDPIICAVGMLASAPLVYLALVAARYSLVLCYIMVFFGELFLNLNWSIVADMVLYVVIPTRRSTAEAFQILISHALGDAGSPYLIGVVSDALKNSYSQDANTQIETVSNITNVALTAVNNEIEFKSLQYALFMTGFVEVLGGIFFLFTAVYILRDKMRVEQIVSVGDASDQVFFEDISLHSMAIGDMNQPKNIYADDPMTEVDQRRNLVS